MKAQPSSEMMGIISRKTYEIFRLGLKTMIGVI